MIVVNLYIIIVVLIVINSDTHSERVVSDCTTFLGRLVSNSSLRQSVSPYSVRINIGAWLGTSLTVAGNWTRNVVETDRNLT